MTIKLQSLQVAKGFVPNEEGINELHVRSHIEIATGESEDSRVFSHIFSQEEATELMTIIEQNIQDYVRTAADGLVEVFDENVKLLKDSD